LYGASELRRSAIAHRMIIDDGGDDDDDDVDDVRYC